MESEDLNNPRVYDLSCTVVLKCGEKIYGEIERKIRLAIKPRPLWIPKKLWEFVLGKMLVMEEFQNVG